MPAPHVKCINTESLEIRLVKLNKAVKRMLAAGDVRWAARKTGEKIQRSDVLLIDSQETWGRLLPYFNLDTEKAGRKHRAKWTDAEMPTEDNNQPGKSDD